MTQGPTQGVLFPRGADGRRSTAATGRAVWADAVRGTDDALAARLDGPGDWRKGYVQAVVAHTAAATRSPETAVTVARRGLAAVGERMVFERDGAVRPVAEALTDSTDGLKTKTVHGRGARRTELQLPYRGSVLRGDELRSRLQSWVDGGTIEASCAGAVTRLLDEPELLDLSGTAFALLGAGAEMGPLEPLLAWGAHVVAVDVPSEPVWTRIRAAAEAGAGTLTLPTDDAGRPGVDLLVRTPEVATFLQGAAGDLPMSVGSYAYADGARHVQLAHAADAVVELLMRVRPGTGYAELATPTDAFAVPEEVVAASRRRYADRGAWGPLQRPARLAGLYRPAYDTVLQRADGTTVGIADVLVPQQGPNYTLAKRVQRWRATVALADGAPVSANVAPATRTRSVLKNRLLAAAYAGAHRFGVEVFAPETTRVLMAALLVHDVRAGVQAPAHPDDLFVRSAAHGGLWRTAYSPPSVLGLAAVTGLPRVLAGR